MLNQHIINYQRYGRGPEIICCLPGYGETGKEFEALANQLGEQYSFVCPDLPLHGQTSWNGPAFDLQHLDEIIEGILLKEGFAEQKIGLLGFSMGGRLALAYAQVFPQRLNKLVLIATDGLHQNFWYWLSTQTMAGRQVFQYTMQNPAILFATMKFIGKLGLLNPGIARFSHSYLNDPNQRTRLFERWTMFRNFKPDLALLQKIIITHQLPALFVFGAFDQLIPSKLIKKLPAGINANPQILILDAGHHLLKPQFAPTIARSIASLKTL